VSVIPVLGKLRQEDLPFGASMGYMVRPCLKRKKKKAMLATQITTKGIDSKLVEGEGGRKKKKDKPSQKCSQF
jgi:hypothetical protein